MQQATTPTGIHRRDIKPAYETGFRKWRRLLPRPLLGHPLRRRQADAPTAPRRRRHPSSSSLQPTIPPSIPAWALRNLICGDATREGWAHLLGHQTTEELAVLRAGNAADEQNFAWNFRRSKTLRR